ncbi:MAG: PLP-dependent aminotransferase family protein [Campylobacter sp.]|nr:PLP-dependent aminotransferase family protein [Campylobacter sp.]
MITYELGNSNLTLYEELFEYLKNDILNGTLKGKLPSKRSLASHLNISITTVQNAYSELLEQGFIYSIEKKGYYVSKGLTISRKIKFKQPSTKKDMSKQLKNLSIPNLETLNFPFATWRKLTQNNSSKFLQTIPYKGSFELRSAICNHLNEYMGLKTTPNLIIIGAGAEYLYMLLVQLLGRDKNYATENPGHIKIRQIYESMGAKCISLNSLNSENLSGIDYLHISPTNHFPTGRTMSIKKRLELIKWADLSPYNFIIEDNFSSEMKLSGRVISTFKSLNKDKVIYISTFSKTLLPTLRISYMILPENLMHKFEEKLSFYSSTVPIFEQFTLAEFIEKGYFSRYLNRLKKLYKTKKNDLLNELNSPKFSSKIDIKSFDSGSMILLNFNKNDNYIRQKANSFGYTLNFTSDFYYDQKPQKSYALIDFLSMSSDEISKLIYEI